MSGPKPLPHREVFESRGETQVRFEFWDRSDEAGKAARAWLAEKQVEREKETASRRDAREERTLAISEDALSIAKEANRIASKDLRWAKWAAIIATTAAVAANKDQIFTLILLILD